MQTVNTYAAQHMAGRGRVLNAADLQNMMEMGTPTRMPGEGDVELDHLLSQVDKTQKRTIWLLHGCLRIDHLAAVLQAASPCSRVVNMLWSDPVTLSHGDAKLIASVLKDERLRTVTADEPEAQARLVSSQIDVDNYVGWKPVLNSRMDPKGVEHLQQFYKSFTGYLNQKAVGRQTQISSSHLFVANALINAVFANPINDLAAYRDLHKNKPILVVATGPSLNKQMPLLAQYKDQFVIVAVDPAVPILKSHGIVPQFVVSIDPKKRPYWKHNELDDDTTFVIEIGCCPDVAWSNNKKYLVTSCHKDVHRLVTALGAHASYLQTGGSVGTTAFNFACHMGGNPVVMIGMDLAWTDGKDHAEGYVSQYSREALDARHAKGFEIEGHDGRPVRTERQLLYYKSWFEQRIRQLPDRLIINSTEGGARIEGATQIPFASVCEEIAKTQLGPWAQDPGQPWAPDFEYLSSFVGNLKKLLTDVETLERKLQNGIRLINGIKKTPKKSVVRQIDEINLELTSSDNWQVKTLVEMMGQTAVAATEHRILVNGLDSDAKSVYGAYLNVYQSAIHGVNLGKNLLSRLISLLDETLSAEKFDEKYLSKYKFNKWLEDGSRKLDSE